MATVARQIADLQIEIDRLVSRAARLRDQADDAFDRGYVVTATLFGFKALVLEERAIAADLRLQALIRANPHVEVAP